jgi:hypothetical protein
MFGIEERTDEIAGEKGITQRPRTHNPEHKRTIRLDFVWFTGHNIIDKDSMGTPNITAIFMVDTTTDTVEDE